MRTATGLFAAMLALQPFSAQAQQAQPDIAALDPQIDGILTKWMASNHVPGLVFGVVRDGRLAYVKSKGVQDIEQKRPVTPDTLFRIASMTKAFTALSILKLRDEGRLGLDDPADRYVPELRGWTYPTSDSPRITIRDLLTHTAGFVTDDPWGDRQTPLSQTAFTTLLRAGVPFTRAPEQRHEYSNLGYAILGRVIANVTKAPYRNYVEQRLLTPLGMTASGFDVLAHPRDKRAIGYRWENEAWAQEPTMKDGAFNSMGGLEVSATDYAKWLGFLLSAWPARNDPETGPARRATVRRMAQGLNFAAVFHRYATGGDKQCPGTVSYGMGWRVIGDCDYGTVLAHGGGFPGYGSHVMVLPEFGVAFFALTNRTYSGPSQPVWDIAALLREKGVIAKRTEPVSQDLGSFYAAAQAVWAAGTVDPLQGRVSMNFPMDRTAANWAKVLAETKARSGPCEIGAPVQPDGAMSGMFTWPCANGKITGTLILAPTRPITLQSLKYVFEPKG
ncbi:serine hydrolase domain-containing protein [Novosphingobium olei]|uniref:serine hydrolase domain-containing protein n=1 Tax=Novosphingobium olei TaxID=2728851 RepID=UPI00308EAE64|nr:serine hydrolase [Novosphingobium olei]